jgi:hypothetical protein
MCRRLTDQASRQSQSALGPVVAGQEAPFPRFAPECQDNGVDRCGELLEVPVGDLDKTRITIPERVQANLLTQILIYEG